MDLKFPNNTPHRNLITFVEDRLGHDRRYAIDNKKLLKHLNITNKSFNNIDSFKSTVSWYVENKNWW